jgi:hypothetical protein
MVGLMSRGDSVDREAIWKECPLVLILLPPLIFPSNARSRIEQVGFWESSGSGVMDLYKNDTLTSQCLETGLQHKLLRIVFPRVNRLWIRLQRHRTSSSLPSSSHHSSLRHTVGLGGKSCLHEQEKRSPRIERVIVNLRAKNLAEALKQYVGSLESLAEKKHTVASVLPSSFCNC